MTDPRTGMEPGTFQPAPRVSENGELFAAPIVSATADGTALDSVSPEIARLKAIIEHERSRAITWIDRIRCEVRRRRRISESRGPYEWDDEAYFKEFGSALDAIGKAVDKAEQETNARSWKDCPGTQAAVEAARALEPDGSSTVSAQDDSAGGGE